MPTLLKSARRPRLAPRPAKSAPAVARRKALVLPVLLPEEIALENAILAAAARDIAQR